MVKGREVKERKRFYWIYRVIEFLGVVLVFLGILFLVGVVGGSDTDDILKIAGLCDIIFDKIFQGFEIISALFCFLCLDNLFVSHLFFNRYDQFG